MPMKRGGDSKGYGSAQPKRRRLAQTQTIPRSMVQNEVRRQISKQADYKSTTYAATGVTVSNFGTVVNVLQTLSRGSAAIDQFEGNSINIQGLHVRANLTVADANNVVRMMIIQWLDSGIPGMTGILDHNGTSLAAEGTKYWTNRQNIRVLRDKCYVLDTVNSPNVEIVEYIPGRKFLQTWFQTTSTTPQNGGVFVCFISDSTAIQHPELRYTCQTIFTD